MNCFDSEAPFYYGAAWYPELWPQADQDREIEWMLKAHINMIRLGEFAWAKMEPEPGHFDFDWLEQVMDKLHAAGIRVVLGTPTATPPRWFSLRYPDSAYVTCEGVQMGHGGRQHICLGAAPLREHGAAVAARLAARLGHHPALIAWQLDNEPKGNANDECFCAACRQGFSAWLEREYDTIDALNEAWGTDVWSQRYEAFSAVPPPLPTPSGHNPSLTTAYARYQHEIACRFVESQAQAVRRHSDLPITVNTNPRHQLNHLETYRNLDFVAFDEYPAPGDHYAMLFNFALWRGLKPAVPFWLMETSPSHGGCIYGGYQAQPPGFHRAIGLAAAASGAGCFAYWLWRRQRTGMEIPHGALLNSWGTPAEGFAQACELGAEIQQLHAELAGRHLMKPEIALLYSDVARAFWRSEPLNQVEYIATMQRCYRSVVDTGHACDIIHPESDLTGYRIIWTPFLPHLPEDLRLRLQRWVESGGRWIVGPLCAYRTKEHTAKTDAGLGKELEAFAGVETRFFYGVAAAPQARERACYRGEELAFAGMSHFFAAQEARVEGVVKGGFGDALAWYTCCERGAGSICLLGALPEPQERWFGDLFAELPPEFSPGFYRWRWQDAAGAIKEVVIDFQS